MSRFPRSHHNILVGNIAKYILDGLKIYYIISENQQLSYSLSYNVYLSTSRLVRANPVG